MNKDPSQPDFYNLIAELSATDPWTDTKFTADVNALVWADAGEYWDGANYTEKWVRIKDRYDGEENTLFGDDGVTP